MAKFCTKCGRPLEEGEVCDCTKSKETYNNTQGQGSQNFQNQTGQQNFNYQGGNNKSFEDKNLKDDFNYWQGKFQEKVGESFKEKVNDYKKMNDEMNYSGGIIVPEIIAGSEGEIPVRQYDLTVFKNVFLGFFTYSKSIGKLLVTNKRVLFSAKGRNINGTTNLQNEFNLNEIAGMSASKNYIPHIGKFILGLIFTSFISSILLGINARLFYDSPAAIKFSGLIFIAIGILASILIKKNNFLSLLAATVILTGATLLLGTGVIESYLPIFANYGYGYYDTPGGFMFLIYIILDIIFFVYYIIRLWVFSQIPNLTFYMDTRAKSSVIFIERRKRRFLGLFVDNKSENSGFDYVLPTPETDLALREVGAIISDIQTQGDYGINKWKNI